MVVVLFLQILVQIQSSYEPNDLGYHITTRERGEHESFGNVRI